MKLPFTVLFLRLALGAMWVISGGVKLKNLDATVVSVRNYKFPLFDVPPGDVILGYGLPWLELLVGILLLVGVWSKANYILSAGMFLMFLIAISYVKYYGLQIDCGCFGHGESPITSMHFVGLIIGLLLIAFLWWKNDVLAEG